MLACEKTEEKATYKNILATFEAGFKAKEDFKLGIEFERLPISAKNHKVVDYSKENGIYDLLRSFARLDGWEYITDDYNIIGLKKDEDIIALEPGCQI